jgi:hypothetical protein
MWAQVDNNTVIRIFNGPTAITIGDNNYPANIFSVWSEEELNALDIWEVVEDNTNKKDPEWYINTNVTHTYNAGTGKVDATYGTAAPLDLADTKSKRKEVINQDCNQLLGPSDWMAVKAFEEGGDVESGWKTWRASVRTKCNSMQAQIDGAADMDALIALYTLVNTGTAEDPVMERPIGEFPKKE